MFVIALLCKNMPDRAAIVSSVGRAPRHISSSLMPVFRVSGDNISFREFPLLTDVQTLDQQVFQCDHFAMCMNSYTKNLVHECSGIWVAAI